MAKQHLLDNSRETIILTKANEPTSNRDNALTLNAGNELVKSAVNRNATINAQNVGDGQNLKSTDGICQ